MQKPKLAAKRRRRIRVEISEELMLSEEQIRGLVQEWIVPRLVSEFRANKCNTCGVQIQINDLAA